VQSSVALLDLPYTFLQQQLVTADGFATIALGRDVQVDHFRLEALHQLRLLVPLFRVRRPRDEIRGAARRGDRQHLNGLLDWTPTTRDALVEARNEGLLFDPASERFHSRRASRREIGERSYESDVYLYSQFQLASLGLIRRLLPVIAFKWKHRGDTLNGVLRVDAPLQAGLHEEARDLREAAFAAAALEPVYLSRITTRLALPVSVDFDEFIRWRSELDATWLLDWLDVDADWIRSRASLVLDAAQRLDRLGRWSEVIGAGSANRWEELQGTPRLVMDMRLVGELLLRYHDRLVKEALAQPTPKPPRTRTPYDLRLRLTRPLDAVLTDFGLSPHPQLILIVEGATERALAPRAMQLLGVPMGDDFIAIRDAEGVRANLGALLAYLAPQPGEIESDRYIRPLRPLTRFLVVFDPEGPVATAESREKRRQGWVERIFLALPQELQKPVVREQLDKFVVMRTWNERGDSFEFAHFSDRQITREIDGLDERASKPSFGDLLERVKEFRRGDKNLKRLLPPGVGKVELGLKLWPTLERRITRALEYQREDEIPLVAVLYEATRLAQEFGRGNTVIALEEPPAPMN
jgi:hypothetical protein